MTFPASSRKPTSIEERKGNLMNRLLSLAFPQIFFAAAFLFFLGWNASNAHAQLKLCPKVGGNCTATGPTITAPVVEEEEEEDEEEPPPPEPTVGNKAFSFWDISSSSSLTGTSDSSGSKTFKPDIKATYTKTKHGRTYTKQGYIYFDAEDSGRRSCAWIPTAMPLKNKIIRIYYTLKFDSDKDNDQGEGTVLAFLPGSTTVSSTLCGGYGEYQGFADRSGYTSMPEPRFGLEFDINRNTSDGFADPDNNHFAIVNNGVKHDGSDSPDCPNSNSNNVTSSPYGACWTGTNVTRKDRSYPWMEEGSTHGYRVEITASSASCAATEVYVKAWVCKSGDSSCQTTAFKTVSSAYAGSATATVAKCVPFNPATYDEVLVGFTFGSGGDDTKATYGSFTMQTFDP